MPKCHTCWQNFEDYKALAVHIMSSGGKCKGKRFASHVLADVKVREFTKRSPMSDEIKQTAKECVRELSGETKKTRTVCPSCKQVTEQSIEVEYIQDRAWRNSNGSFIINCWSCRKK